MDSLEKTKILIYWKKEFNYLIKMFFLQALKIIPKFFLILLYMIYIIKDVIARNLLNGIVVNMSFVLI